MKATTMNLDENVHNRLEPFSDKQVSMAELIRRAVDEHLKKYQKKGGRKK